ncbi:MAG: hypothetical protein KF817_14560 [Phycisphaeraceae bacterium]|nr:hypothetical protein [Phycisphaeraceae bacterium]
MKTCARIRRGLLLPACLAAAAAPAALAWTAGADDPAVASTVATPSATEIVEKSIKAIGGREAIEKLESSYIKGQISSPMGEITMEISTGKGDRFLLVQMLPGGMGEMKMGSDGKVGWMLNPMMGGYELLEGPMLDMARQQVGIFNMVAPSRDEIAKMTAVGSAEFNGRKAWKLRQVDDEGEQFLFYDAEKHLLLGTEARRDAGMGPVTMKMLVSDWKPAGDLQMFRKVTIQQGMGMDMVLNLVEVTHNKVEAKAFELPDEVKALLEKRKDASVSPGRSE